jgi:hypothetical protein
MTYFSKEYKFFLNIKVSSEDSPCVTRPESKYWVGNKKGVKMLKASLFRHVGTYIKLHGRHVN